MRFLQGSLSTFDSKRANALLFVAKSKYFGDNRNFKVIKGVAMASLPYITSSGNIAKAMQTIKSAAVPDRVSQDFVKTILKIPGGSGDQMTTFLKKIGFSDASGKPSEIYTKFRNPSFSGQAMAQAIRKAYGPLYTRNEYTHELSEPDLTGLVMEETGLAHDSNPVKMTVSCIKALKEFASFSDDSAAQMEDKLSEPEFTATVARVSATDEDNPAIKSRPSVGLNLGYTINLNLPPSTDPAVFNAIFKSLKEHLLSNDDG